jgi:DNA-binding LacI/PurR family transcriptional regulator
LTAASLPVAVELVCHLEDSNTDTETAVAQLVERGAEAIFCYNDVAAMVAVGTLKARYPQKNVCVVGYDGIQQHSVQPITLTTVTFDYDAVVRDVVDTVIRRIEGDVFDCVHKVYDVSLLEQGEKNS